MKPVLKYIFASLAALVAFSCVDTNLPEADAAFVIEKDTIIDGVKTRVEIIVADTINPIYFVYKGSSMHNSVWPGDKIKNTAFIFAEGEKRPTKTTYYVSQDYNTKKDSLLMTWAAKKDTFMTQRANLYQGIALPYGTKEIEYTFQSKGDLIITWISINANEKKQSENIMQKTILVK